MSTRGTSSCFFTPASNPFRRNTLSTAARGFEQVQACPAALRFRGRQSAWSPDWRMNSTIFWTGAMSANSSAARSTRSVREPLPKKIDW